MDSGTPDSLERKNAQSLQRWQQRLQPFMAAAIAALAVFFLAASVMQLDRLGQSLQQRPDAALIAALADVDSSAGKLDAAQEAELKRWKVLALMERDIVRQRYGGTASIMLLSAWTRQMGFITGMILAFIGAVFILGKMNDSGTQLSGEGTGLKGSLTTSSPGIVLCVLGTILMLVTLNIKTEFQTFDKTVYIPAGGAPLQPSLHQALDPGNADDDTLPSDLDPAPESPSESTPQ